MQLLQVLAVVSKYWVEVQVLGGTATQTEETTEKPTAQTTQVAEPEQCRQLARVQALQVRLEPTIVAE
jgi:hypothetical protein